MNHLRRISCVALTASLLAPSALSLARAQGTKKLRVIFPTTSETLQLPFWVAIQQGWLDAELITVAGDSNALRALLSGQGDVAVVGVFNVFLAIAEGARAKAISSWQGVNDYQMIVPPKIQTLQDLSGKVIAATGPGGPPEEFARVLLKKYKMDPASVRFVSIAGGHAGLLQAVAAGRADAALVNTSTALRGEKGGQVRILYSIAKEFPSLGYVYNLVRNEDAANPALRASLDNFVLAGIRASRFIVENTDAAVKLAHEKFPESDPALLKSALEHLVQDGVWGVNGGIEPKATGTTLALARSTGLLKKDLAPEQVFDTRFVNAAMAQAGNR